LNDLKVHNIWLLLRVRYFNEFAKPAFQLTIGSSSTELIDQKSASVTRVIEVSVRNHMVRRFF